PDPLERLAPRRRLKGAALPRGWPFAKPPGAVHPAISAVHPVNPAVRPTLLQTRRCVVPLWRDSVFANWRSRMPHDAVRAMDSRRAIGGRPGARRGPVGSRQGHTSGEPTMEVAAENC